ncbi:hypothetical protein [Nocardia suismassiliense]|uniref:hypothetical protein n=1 Tax=Nocardia suismassiliense TaxID=2077092 RepID=UPI00131F07E8|nr:hypothetical protein [Nocardia suismassiliense]
MSEPAVPVTTQWTYHLSHWPGRTEIEDLQRLGFTFPTIEDQNEWIIGFLILDDRLESMAIVYVTRSTADAGIDFELRAAGQPPGRAAEIFTAIQGFVTADTGFESIDEEIARLWLLTDEQLLQEFGAQLVHGARNDSGGEQDLRRRAQNWFATNHSELQDLICGNPDVRRITESPEGVARLAGLLTELLAGPTVHGVAVYLLRRGLDKLCAPTDNIDQDS